jgi:hypothetical protein
MPAYDLHQHLWPEPFVAALRRRRSPPFLSDGELTTPEGRFPVELASHEPEERIRLLDRDGIDVAVVSLQTTLGLERLAEAEREDLEERWVEGIREVVRETRGRLLAFSPGRVRECFVGVSLGATSLAGSDEAERALDAATEADVPVFVHPDRVSTPPTGRPAWWDWATGYPARMHAAYLAWLTAAGAGRSSASSSRSSPGEGRSSSSGSRDRASTSARRSTRTRSSTSRRTAAARSSCASRRSASGNSPTGATRRSSTRARPCAPSAVSGML